MPLPSGHTTTPHHHDAGLRALSILELSKALLATTTGVALEWIGPEPIKAFIQRLIELFQLSPDHGMLASALKLINPHAIHLTVAVILIYASMRYLESWGLWHERTWASWLGCIGTALYLPMDSYALYHHPGWQTLAVVIVNLLITAYLAHDILARRRQRRHA